MCKLCVAHYTEATFPEAEACEVCLGADSSGGSWLFTNPKFFQCSKLVCTHMKPGCKKRTCTRRVTVVDGTPPRLEREDRTRTSPLRSRGDENRSERSGTTPQQLFTTESCASCRPPLNPESLMKLQLATAGDVTVPPQIADGRSSFGPAVHDAKPAMKSKMRTISTVASRP